MVLLYTFIAAIIFIVRKNIIILLRFLLKNLRLIKNCRCATYTNFYIMNDSYQEEEEEEETVFRSNWCSHARVNYCASYCTASAGQSADSVQYASYFLTSHFDKNIVLDNEQILWSQIHDRGCTAVPQMHVEGRNLVMICTSLNCKIIFNLIWYMCFC